MRGGGVEAPDRRVVVLGVGRGGPDLVVLEHGPKGAARRGPRVERRFARRHCVTTTPPP
jgi:hypothetical protein